MDALLRQAARSGEFVSANEQTHLDADEISAFAENALPEKTQAVYVRHFADCDRCRTILSNLILLKIEAETETASAAVIVAPEIVETATPWYRRIFAVPNLAYTLGGLVLVFGGFLGFLVLQNTYNYQNAEVSRISDNEPKASSPNIGSGETSYNSNAMSMNRANASTNSAANTSIMMSNATAADTNASTSAANATTTAPTPQLLAKENRDEPKQLAEEQTEAKPPSEDAKTKNEKDAVTDQTIAQEREAVKLAPAPAKPVQATPPPSSVAGGSELSKTARAKKSAKNEDKTDLAGETTRQISGKNFNRKNGVWYDTAYNNQKTTNVRRNTDNYRKLDSGLRIIAESLDGTVVVVWKEKAYRIQ